MGKEAKTNAMRILDKHKIPYEVEQYECTEFKSGSFSARQTGKPAEQTFKTLVLQGKSRQYYVFVLPVDEEVDLKKAARVAEEKSVGMIHVKDITTVTGYVRGGCSPLGMKKLFPTIIHTSARQYDAIYVSAGRIGLSVRLNPEQLAEVIRGSFADIIVSET